MKTKKTKIMEITHLTYDYETQLYAMEYRIGDYYSSVAISYAEFMEITDNMHIIETVTTTIYGNFYAYDFDSYYFDNDYYFNTRWV